MSNDDNVELTDGFHVLIDALKMNDIDTMYGVVMNNTQATQLLSPVTLKENQAFA